MRGHSHTNEATLDEAIQRWWAALAAGQALQCLPGEFVALDQANGRVTAEPVWAKVNSPHYRAAAMDGYAVRAHETAGAQPGAPIHLLLGQQALMVDTGDVIPELYDAVIMREETARAERWLDQQMHAVIAITKPVEPGQHIRQIGEDIQANQLILPTNHQLRAADIGAVAGAGHACVYVRRQPRIAILPTGSELVEPGAALKPGDIIEYNSLMLAAAAQECGAIPTRLPKVADDFEQIKTAVAQALQIYDLVIVNAGSSAGREDYTAAVFETLGTLVVQGIAMRPGHPTILAYADVELERDGKRRVIRRAMAGLPGYPVSAAITFDLLIKPLLAQWQGQAVPLAEPLTAKLTQAVSSSPEQDEFVRVSLGEVGDHVMATPLTRRAGTSMSLVRTDGLLHLPRGHSGYALGETVTVARQNSLAQIYDTIVAIGVMDRAVEILIDQLRQQNPALRLVLHPTNHATLLDLQHNQAHLAVSHLRYTGEDEYNLPSVQQLLPEQAVLVVHFVEQEQSALGFVIPKLHYGDRKIERLLEVVRSHAFRQRMEHVGGYKTEKSGEVIA
ncbi:MAG: molybdopterin-binding protein [Chloroflexi bacterium]|nr:molybdopterin-binding protein [Chloroflexota bacterium]